MRAERFRGEGEPRILAGGRGVRVMGVKERRWFAEGLVYILDRHTDLPLQTPIVPLLLAPHLPPVLSNLYLKAERNVI